MRKAMVIGGSGFIGEHVMEECRNKKWNVINIDKRDCDILLDITKMTLHDYTSLNFASFDYVYHLAAMAYIEDCWQDPVNAVVVNIEGLCRVLERIKQDSIPPLVWKPRFVYASSMYVYNTASGPYGITKRAAEDLIKWYQRESKIPYTILRYGSIYGPGAKDSNSIKRLIKNALKTGVISYYGSGEEVREYIHVKDLAKITVELACTSEFENSTVNLTGQYPMKAKDMCFMLRDILGEEYKVEFRNERPFNHYMVTPYRYEGEVAKKYVAQSYYELGAGFLELIKELDNGD